jgi:hypothetical protein
MQAANLDYTKLGAMLRASALDAHNGELPSLDIAYTFMLDNPEYFIDGDEWSDMPAVAPEALAFAYYQVSSERELMEIDIAEQMGRTA